VLEALINAFSADLKHVLARNSMSSKVKQKSMKSRISNDFTILALKSLRNFSIKKLSTVSSTIAA
jgi:hypothetical protein